MSCRTREGGRVERHVKLRKSDFAYSHRHRSIPYRRSAAAHFARDVLITTLPYPSTHSAKSAAPWSRPSLGSTPSFLAFLGSHVAT